MTQKLFMDKYPINTIKLSKNNTEHKTVAEILDTLKSKIDQHKIATYIGLFDHYTHTKSLDGDIMDGMLDAQNIIFSFGPAIPNSEILSVRPRSIGVTEFEDRFELCFMDAPKEQLTELMISWIKSI
jgi:hypothetical protein